MCTALGQWLREEHKQPKGALLCDTQTLTQHSQHTGIDVISNAICRRRNIEVVLQCAVHCIVNSHVILVGQSGETKPPV